MLIPPAVVMRACAHRLTLVRNVHSHEISNRPSGYVGHADRKTEVIEETVDEWEGLFLALLGGGKQTRLVLDIVWNLHAFRGSLGFGRRATAAATSSDSS